MVGSKKYYEDFEKSFASFMDKCPLVPSKYEMDYQKGEVTVLYGPWYENEAVFGLDFEKGPKENIADIKNNLIDSYPILHRTIKRMYSSKEIEDMVATKGIPLSEALKLRKEEVTEVVRIIRIHPYQATMDCKDMRNNMLLKYKIRVPLIIFMKKIKEVPGNEMQVLQQYGQFLYSYK